jgi:hypothetical protein
MDKSNKNNAEQEAKLGQIMLQRGKVSGKRIHLQGPHRN